MKHSLPFLGLLATVTGLSLSSCDTTRETVSTAASPATMRSEANGLDTITSYHRDLTQGTTQYNVKTTGDGSMRMLTVAVRQNGRPLASRQDTLDGEVQQTALLLTPGGQPNLLVFVQSAGSGSYGQLYGYWVDGQALRRLPGLPDLAGAASQGYQGHDSLQVLSQEVVRSFPIYAPADANCCPSGGQRTVRYTLVNPSQGWRQVRVEQTSAK
ncbi:hypothetical protein HMJ29_16240 [Hymenobacter taeanensis]|uniref:Uncharacterized protein n=1 Tax=Hymenobacter taeanensis TaxID=2735321 RepID=A0A6M6BJX0_9BACT|nr:MULTISPECIES: hypothetical protein [Hymenobacter]QJX48386.1 hypothetical protein HMJ29_16240 [Hymenobacter taeanensis]UOQ82120.1 hypothetical protein MUN83_04905 [Hymenobacter sp. 5414T-23]